MASTQDPERSRMWVYAALLGLLVLSVTTVLVVAFAVALAPPTVTRVHAAPGGAAAKDTRPIVTIIGDSFTGGSEMDSGATSLWWSLLADQLHFLPEDLGVGGSGYVAVSAKHPSGGSFVTRATRVDPASRVVIVFGSINDGVDDLPKLPGAVTVTLAAIARTAPHATIVVVGPPWINSHPPANVLESRAIVRAAAIKAHARWIDPIADGWFPNGNSLIGSDGMHPNDAGETHIAALMNPVIGVALADTAG